MIFWQPILQERAESVKMLPVLRTKRLVLRPFTIDDAKRVQELVGVKEVVASLPDVPYPYVDGLAEEWIGGHARNFREGRSLDLAISSKETNELMGAVGLQLDSYARRASLGYWLGRDYWNKGFCTEAVGILLGYGFFQLDLNRIYGTHLDYNLASGRVMSKLGMKKEGVLRSHVKRWDKLYDYVYYGLLRAEFIQRIQPAIIDIDEELRLRAYDGNFHLALPWYRDKTVYTNSEGIRDQAAIPDINYVRRMYDYLHGHGELYFIEIKREGNFVPVGDVTLQAKNLPITIGVKKYRRQGIGRRVLQEILKRARALGLVKIHGVRIYDYNLASQRLYESLGFKCVGIEGKELEYELSL